MKKNPARKMVLHRETLRALTADQTHKIFGGIGPSDLVEDSCYHTCWCDTTR